MKSFDEIQKIEEQKQERIRQAKAELAAITEALTAEKEKYGQLESEGDPAADDSLKELKRIEESASEQKRRINAIIAGQQRISERQKEMASSMLKEAAEVNRDVEVEKQSILQELQKAKVEYIALLKNLLNVQGQQEQVKNELDQVFGTYPGACKFGQSVFAQRPPIKIIPLPEIPFVKPEDLRKPQTYVR